MGPDDATDVAKALAAFGAPSIRYHSFGQGQVKPSSVVLPPLDLAPLEPEAGCVPAPHPAMPAATVPSKLPVAPHLAGLVLRPVALLPVAAPPAPLRQMAPPPAAPPLTAPPLVAPPPAARAPVARPPAAPPPVAPPLFAPMPPMPAFRRTLDPVAPARSVLPHVSPSQAPPAEASAAIALTLRASPEGGRTVGESLAFSAGQTLPPASAAMRPPAKPPSAPPVSIQANAPSKPAVLPLLGRSAPAAQRGQSLAAIFAFLASDPTPGEASPFS